VTNAGEGAVRAGDLSVAGETCDLSPMKRPLVVVGAPESLVLQVARRVADVARAELLDLTAPLAPEGAAEVEARRTALERAVSGGAPRVVASPSALLRRRATRLSVLDQGVVVALDGPQTRLEDAGPELAARAEEREAEAAVYQEVHARLAGGFDEVEALAGAAATAWDRDTVAVAAGARSYVVEVGRGLIPERVPELVGEAPVVLVVTDSTVDGLHGALLSAPLARLGRPVARHVMAPGERSKVLGSVEQIWSRALAAGLDRGSLVFGFGGGVVTDTAGFAAATWMRGVRWAALPTTLLAMVDASVGGKTGVDLREAKNAVGAFWQPSAVVCDITTLHTEARQAFASALAEVIKTALIGDPTLLELVEHELDGIMARDPAILTEVVLRSVRVKARIVSLDERESGLRAVLNLGHTVGHALETLGGYAALTHGEAVSLGLVAALRIGERRAVTPADLTRRVVRLLARAGLPTDLARQDLEAAGGILGHDKKRAGDAIRFVFASAPGSVTVERLTLAEVREHLRSLR